MKNIYKKRVSCAFLCTVGLLLILSMSEAKAQAARKKDTLSILYEKAYNNFNNTEGLKDAERLFKLAGEKNNIQLQAKALLIKAKYYDDHLDNVKFRKVASEIMDWLHENKSYNEYYHIWIYSILSYIEDKRYVDAFNQINRMQAQALKENAQYGIQASYRMMGNLFEARLAYSEALKFFQKELDYAKEIKSSSLYSCYFNIANCEYSRGHYERALKYSRAGRFLSELPVVLVAFDIQEGIIYGLTGDYTRMALCYNRVKVFKKSYFMDHKLRRESDIFDVVILWSQKDFDNAYRKLSAMNENDRIQLLPFHYKKQGRYEDALKAQERLTVYTDSLNNISSTQELTDFGIRMEEQRLLHEKQMLAMENAKIRSQQQYTIALCIFIILIALQICTALIIAYQRKKEKIIEAERDTKDRFIQDMSHEIRTPLNAINGFVSVIVEGQVNLSDDEKNKFVSLIKENTEQLTLILDNMLRLYSLESGHTIFTFSEVNPYSVCSEAFGAIREYTPEKVNMWMPDSLPRDIAITSDEGQLVRLLTSLLVNSCRNTNEGEITIGFNTTENKDCITFYVQDTGCGVPADKSEEIFKRFVKLSRFKPGIGVGLTIDRLIAKELHATLKLDLQYKHGARFVLIHPYQR